MGVKHRVDDLAAMRQGRPTPKQAKIAELGEACDAAIYAGVTVETKKGAEHFSLTLKDQKNLDKSARMAEMGANVLYHADGQLCRHFTPEEMLAIAAAAIGHITYHTTLCNHYNMWVRRTEDDAELDAIHYGAKLPDDLAARMAALLGGDSV